MSEEDSTNKYISTTIKKRKEVYHLVTERDLNSVRNYSIFGDIFIILASIVLSGYFIEKNIYVLFAGIAFILTAIGFYYFKLSFLKDIKSSGEVKSVTVKPKIFNIEVSDALKIADDSESEVEKELEIIKASYRTGTHFKDVTKEISDKVENNKLSIVASNDIAGDPHPGTPKTLEIIYRFDGVDIIKEFKEKDKVELP